MMTMATKQEIVQDKLGEYLQATREQKGTLLTELGSVTGFSRKALIRRLGRLQLDDPHKPKRKRGRKEVYGPAVTLALKDIWTLFHELCADRLHPHLSEYVQVLQKFEGWPHPAAVTKLTLAMSLATCKRRINTLTRILRGPGGKGTTKASGLKEIIPIRRGPWDNPPPGKGEVDTVAHCGMTTAGDYVFTVQYTDVATIWTCLSAQWNKGQEATKQSFERMSSRLPFPLLAIDPDSGSEFINWTMKRWCDKQAPSVEMTRIRPYYKNDHARIEQKNYTNVREFLGYTRIESSESVVLMNELYDYLEDYINFFLPSQKCIKKERQGSKYRRIYDTARTAYQRVLEDVRIDQGVKDRLRDKYATLNPTELKKHIDRLLKTILTGTRYTPSGNT